MAALPEPSETELEVLKAFWRGGPLSAREAHIAVGERLGWAPSTTRTVLERMRVKSLLTRRSLHGLAVYSAVGDKVSILGAALRRLVRGVMEVRGAVPASSFAGSGILTEKELEQLELLLNEGSEGQP